MIDVVGKIEYRFIQNMLNYVNITVYSLMKFNSYNSCIS